VKGEEGPIGLPVSAPVDYFFRCSTTWFIR